MTPQVPAEDPPYVGRVRRLLRGVAVDVSPLRTSRDFRLLFVGQSVTWLGSMVTYVAIPFQAYALTRSSWLVGLLGLAELLPLLATALVGGAVADAVDRRRMIRVTEAAFAVVSGGLVVNALLPHPHVWVLFAAAGGTAAIDGLQRPSVDALLPRVVSREQVPAAVALGSLRADIGMVAGPPLAGLLVATAGLPAAYLLDVVSFALSLWALQLMRAAPPPPDAARPGVRTVVEGWRYARSRPELMGTYLVDLNAMFFGMPTALLPAVAARYGGAGVLGVLYAAPALGSLVVSATSGWAPRVHRHGRAVVLAAGGWGLAIVGFGLAPWLWLAVALLVLAGAADMVSGLFRGTIWNQTIPDQMRGRLAGIEMLSYSTGPLLGNAEAGAVATATGVRFSVVSGGLLCVAGTVALAVGLKGFWAYDDRVPVTASDGTRPALPLAGATAG